MHTVYQKRFNKLAKAYTPCNIPAYFACFVKITSLKLSSYNSPMLHLGVI